MGIWYATREQLKDAADVKSTAVNNLQLDRALEGGSRFVDALCHRVFYPQVDTRYFEWPRRTSSASWRLWLDENDLISLTTLTVAGVVISSADYFLEPANSGPPYRSIEIDRSSNAVFASGSTPQRSVVAVGLWAGAPVDEAPAGDLDEALDSSETGVDVSGSSSGLIGVGQIIRVDDERMRVTEREFITSGQTMQTALTALASSQQFTVTTGTEFARGEVILIDSERMLIQDIVGNDLVVKRAWDGTTLAAHSGDTVYAARRLTVVRGVLGTTAATHSDNTAIVSWVPPGLVNQLTLAEAMNTLAQEDAQYARTAGSGDSESEVGGRALEALRKDVKRAHGRKIRMAAV